jgi:hypothetical protein
MISERMFNTTCTIARPVLEKSSSGAVGLDALTTVYSALACSLQPDTTSSEIEHKRLRGTKGATLFIRAKTSADVAITVLFEDQVTVGSETWRVVGPSIDASAGRGELLRVPLEAPLST